MIRHEILINLFIHQLACTIRTTLNIFSHYPTNGATIEIYVFLREVSPGDGVSPKLHNIMRKGINSGWKTCVYHQYYHYPLLSILIGTYWS
jgi:hypothetical protein